MTWMRTPVVGLLVLLAIVFQVSLFSSLEIDGVAPDLALLVVIAAALVRGPEYATVLGFVAGLLVDIAPPPVLTRLVGADERVAGGLIVAGGVAAGRVVAAADPAALDAEPQVHPDAPGGQAVLAARSAGADHADLVEVGAVIGHRARSKG